MTETNIEKGDMRPYLVISDTHFGAVHDKTAGEETSIEELKNLLDCIEKNKVDTPGNIILLGDIFDLWRTEFEDAFKEAESIGFFKRLSKYAKDNDTKITYVVGNHDHRIKEIDLSYMQLSDIERIIKEEKKKEENNSYTLDNIKIFKEKYSINLKYPYHIVDIPSIGVTVFDHGHYADGTSMIARRSLRTLVFILRFVSERKILDSIKYLILGAPKREVKYSWKNITNNLESTLSAGYSAIYFSKFDKKTQEYRNYIYNDSQGLMILACAVILLLVGTGVIIGAGPIKGIIVIIVILTIIFSFYKIYKRIIIPLLKFLGIKQLESPRGNDVRQMSDKIKNDDVTLRRNNEEKYSYYTLLTDMIQDKYALKNIGLYVFGHTHVAGYYEDRKNNFKICNSGAWVKKTSGKAEHCASSFVLIDPKKSKVKVCRMENGNPAECKIGNDGNCNNECKYNLQYNNEK